jgi:hypothetical protein
MSNPQTLNSLMQIGLVPQGTVLLEQKDIMLELTNQPSSSANDEQNTLDAPLVTKKSSK